MSNVKVVRVKESFDWIDIVRDRHDSRYSNNSVITETQLLELKEKWMELELDTKLILWGDRRFKFINYVGFIHLQDIAFEILPKLSLQDDSNHIRTALIEMINTCYDFNISIEYASNELEQGNLKELFAKHFADMLLKELHRGISQEYGLVEENTTLLKGQLRVAEHIRNNILTNKPYHVAVSYEERINNHALNQVLKRATSLLLNVVHNFETKSKLQRISNLLDDVIERSFTRHQLGEIKLNRTNRRFKTSFELAKQILLNETTKLQHHKHLNTFVLMFKMNDLFETYIAILLEEIVDRPVYSQDERHRLFKNEKTNRDIFQLKPDVVIGDNKQIIVDTKWKRVFNKEDVSRSGIKREDMFQMYAYLTRYKLVSRGILLYPKTEQLLGEDLFLQSWKVQGTDILLRAYVVSLSDRATTESELLQILHDVSN